MYSQFVDLYPRCGPSRRRSSRTPKPSSGAQDSHTGRARGSPGADRLIPAAVCIRLPEGCAVPGTVHPRGHGVGVPRTGTPSHRHWGGSPDRSRGHDPSLACEARCEDAHRQDQEAVRGPCKPAPARGPHREGFGIAGLPKLGRICPADRSVGAGRTSYSIMRR